VERTRRRGQQSQRERGRWEEGRRKGRTSSSCLDVSPDAQRLSTRIDHTPGTLVELEGSVVLAATCGVFTRLFWRRKGEREKVKKVSDSPGYGSALRAFHCYSSRPPQLAVVLPRDSRESRPSQSAPSSTQNSGTHKVYAEERITKRFALRRDYHASDGVVSTLEGGGGDESCFWKGR
jgi:hypothetical protein